MRSVIVEDTKNGLHLEPDEMRALGMTPGERFELRSLPDATRVRYLALAFVVKRLGDAIGVGEPEWDGDEWHLELFAPDQEGRIGKLALDARGEVIEDRSATHESVRKAYRAANTPSKAAA